MIAAESQLQDAVCLVTGATGFLGGHLCGALARAGARVRALVRSPGPAGDVLHGQGVRLHPGNLTNVSAVEGAVKGCDYIFHCAAMVSDWGTISEIRAANITGTQHLLDAAMRQRVKRFVHISTTDVYGHPGGRQVTETQALSPRFANWYAQTKLEAEAIVAERAKAAPYDYVIVRPATVYGPRSVNVIGEIAKALRQGRMLLINGGKTIAGLCFVDNLVAAIVAAATRTEAVGEAFNISDGLSVSWRQFLADLAQGLSCTPKFINLPYGLSCALALSLEQGYRGLRGLTGCKLPALLSRQAVQVMGVDQDFSTAKAKRLLGYRVQVDYDEGLARTLEWLKFGFHPFFASDSGENGR